VKCSLNSRRENHQRFWEIWREGFWRKRFKKFAICYVFWGKNSRHIFIFNFTHRLISYLHRFGGKGFGEKGLRNLEYVMYFGGRIVDTFLFLILLID